MTDTFSILKGIYENKNFVLVHRSYLINLAYVERISQYEIILKNGKRFSLGRDADNIKEIKAKFYNYVMGRM
jgi:DNA-binding LytR/AlgR family response regulator